MKILNEDATLEGVDTLIVHPANPRHGDIASVQESIRVNGWFGAVLAQRSTRHVLAGNHRLQAARNLGMPEVPTIWLDVDDEEATRILLADNRTSDLATYRAEGLAQLLQNLAGTAGGLAGTGYVKTDLDGLLAELAGAGGKGGHDYGAPGSRQGAMQADFVVPPFTVLDGRKGYWAARKAAWLGTGLDSGQGRADKLLADAEIWLGSGTSIFDPVLAEIACRWFCPPGGTVLDPFAGGSVRGAVAAGTGRQYIGVDLRAEQVLENRQQWEHLRAKLGGPDPEWVVGDSTQLGDVLGHLEHVQLQRERPLPADLVFSCPPYADLEQYSDDPADLSNMDYEAFLAAYRTCIDQACQRLANDRFAVWVVGEVRGPDGCYRGFVPDTIAAFRAAGLQLYNEATYVTPVGSLPVRAGRAFRASRKMGKAHQQFLVFVKGDPVAATAACGEVIIDDPGAQFDHTPVQEHGGVLVKRDDLFDVGGVNGGKVRSCWLLAQGATGLVTAGSRMSPQCNIVAHIGRHLGIPVQLHCPTGKLSPELQAAKDAGAEVVQHKPGHNSVIIARAREAAAQLGYREIPFGMECPEAISSTAHQVAALPWGSFKRIVIPVGSGMSLAGLLQGMEDGGHQAPVLGVCVGAEPEARLDRWAPEDWRQRATLVRSALDYHAPAPEVQLGDLQLDEIYEAKCLPYLQPGDLLWVVGIRQTATASQPKAKEPKP